MATLANFLFRGVVRRRRAFGGERTSSKEIGQNVHSFRFFRTRIFCLPIYQKKHSRTLSKELRPVIFQ